MSRPPAGAEPGAGPLEDPHTGTPAPEAGRSAAGVLACLPGMTPAMLRRILAVAGDPVRALHIVQAGHAEALLAPTPPRPGRPGDDLLGAGGRHLAAHHDHGETPSSLTGTAEEERQRRRRDLARRWAGVDAAALRRRLQARGTRVYLPTDPDWPLPDDLPDPPAVLLAEGARPAVLAQPRVAIVGTRAASPHGLADAAEFGGALAGAGVTVVSGLAVGIDAAAHEGALGVGGGVVGVLATGLDVAYPRRHGPLHARVREAGLLCTEAGFGTRPEPHRFPIRNRIIAGLADVVVVVEATVRGGAMITARLALEYGRTVFALPGSRRNPAAVGCNALLAEGPVLPLLSVDDVLLALGMTPGARRGPPGPATEAVGSPDAMAVLAALAGEPAGIDALCARTGMPVDRVLAAVAELRRDGRARRERGLVWPC